MREKPYPGRGGSPAHLERAERAAPSAPVSPERLIVLGYFPAFRPCIRWKWYRSSLPRAIGTAYRWLQAGAERVQVQRRTEAGAVVVCDARERRLLIVPDETDNRRLSGSW